jgi:hypothetical protein
MKKPPDEVIDAKIRDTEEDFKRVGIPFEITQRPPEFCGCDKPYPCCDWCLRCLLCGCEIYGYVLAGVYSLGQTQGQEAQTHLLELTSQHLGQRHQQWVRTETVTHNPSCLCSARGFRRLGSGSHGLVVAVGMLSSS